MDNQKDLIQSDKLLLVLRDINYNILKKHSLLKIGLLEYSKENQEKIGNLLLYSSDGLPFTSKTTSSLNV
jgi:hypothetical protein